MTRWVIQAKLSLLPLPMKVIKHKVANALVMTGELTDSDGELRALSGPGKTLLHHSLANCGWGQRSNSLTTTYCCHLDSSKGSKGKMSKAMKGINNGCAVVLVSKAGGRAPHN